jgi:hypothetical protein
MGAVEIDDRLSQRGAVESDRRALPSLMLVAEPIDGINQSHPIIGFRRRVRAPQQAGVFPSVTGQRLRRPRREQAAGVEPFDQGGAGLGARFGAHCMTFAVSLYVGLM